MLISTVIEAEEEEPMQLICCRFNGEAIWIVKMLEDGRVKWVERVRSSSRWDQRCDTSTSLCSILGDSEDYLFIPARKASGRRTADATVLIWRRGKCVD